MSIKNFCQGFIIIVPAYQLEKLDTIELLKRKKNPIRNHVDVKLWKTKKDRKFIFKNGLKYLDKMNYNCYLFFSLLKQMK